MAPSWPDSFFSGTVIFRLAAHRASRHFCSRTGSRLLAQFPTVPQLRLCWIFDASPSYPSTNFQPAPVFRQPELSPASSSTATLTVQSTHHFGHLRKPTEPVRSTGHCPDGRCACSALLPCFFGPTGAKFTSPFFIPSDFLPAAPFSPLQAKRLSLSFDLPLPENPKSSPLHFALTRPLGFFRDSLSRPSLHSPLGSPFLAGAAFSIAPVLSLTRFRKPSFFWWKPL